MKKVIISTKKQVTLEGLMNLGKLNNGLHTMDFMSMEDVDMEAFIGRCKVQMMRDGNMYITELPKRVKNKPMFRDDNCSLSLGRDGRYYFVFSLPEQLVNELPKKLVRQASAIAQKVVKELIISNEQLGIRN
jgi:hypothetical protein